MRLLGIDVGAQSVRVSVFDGRGNVLGSSQLPHTIERPHRGWAEANPELWWQAVLDGLKTASAQAKIDPQIIQGIGISNMCPSLVAMDRNGEVLRPAILYQDQRSLPQVEALLSSINLDSIFEISANRVAPGTYSASSIRWIKARESEVCAKAHCFGHANSFLGMRLTGNFGLDWTNASFTGLFETGKRRSWSQDLCKAWGVPMEKLPEPLPSWANLGGVCGQAASITGLEEGTPVAMGAADTACSALGAGVTEPGQGFDTAGSSDVLAFCIDQPIFDIRFMNRCHSVPERWLAMGALLSPGAALSWFRNQILSVAQYEILNEEAERSGPGANQVIFLPYMQGERSPIWDSMARGVLFGLSLETTRGDLVRAVMEGTAYGLRQNLEIAVKDLGYSLREIRLGGGGAKSDLWCQIKADVLDRPLVRLDEEETAVLGAGMLGGIAAGLYSDHQEAVNQAAARPSRTFSPRPELSPAYERVYQIYCELYPRLKEPFRTLAQATDNLCFEPSSC
jgi:xylulokinase